MSDEIGQELLVSSVSQPDESPIESELDIAFDITPSESFIETNENSNDPKDVPAAKPSRELISLLKLSREANLDTNIAHKRKTIHGDNEDRNTPTKKLSVGIDSSDEWPERTGLKRRKSEPYLRDEKSKRIKKDEDVDLSIIKDLKKDAFCWKCHKGGISISCTTCPRSYHQRCVQNKSFTKDTSSFQCPECVSILSAENSKTRAPYLQGMSIDHLCKLLTFAHNRILAIQDIEPFNTPVNEEAFPDYTMYIIQPMDLTRLFKNIEDRLYGSPNAYEADVKWIYHNSIIFNSHRSKLTGKAKHIKTICRQEMYEIETCPSCYYNANVKDDWFVDICPKPHPLVWAKLKGFPFWPAKAMGLTSLGNVDVRFFGKHDRAYVDVKNCYFYSKKNPNSTATKRNEINECLKEANIYIENIKKKFGWFKYSRYKLPFDIEKQELQYKCDKKRGTNDGLPESEKVIKKLKNDGDDDEECMEEEENKSYIDIYRNDNSYEDDSKDDEEDFTIEIDPMTVINTVLGCATPMPNLNESLKLNEDKSPEDLINSNNTKSPKEDNSPQLSDSLKGDTFPKIMTVIGNLTTPEKVKSPEKAISLEKAITPERPESSEKPKLLEKQISSEKAKSAEKSVSQEIETSQEKPVSRGKSVSPEKSISTEQSVSPEKLEKQPTEKSSENPKSSEKTKTVEKWKPLKLSQKSKSVQGKLKISDKLFKKFNSESNKSPVSVSKNTDPVNNIDDDIKKYTKKIDKSTNVIIPVVILDGPEEKQKSTEENKNKSEEIVNSLEKENKSKNIVDCFEIISGHSEDDQSKEQENDLLDILYTEAVDENRSQKKRRIRSKSKSRNKEKVENSAKFSSRSESLVKNTRLQEKENGTDKAETVLLNSLLDENAQKKSAKAVNDNINNGHLQLVENSEKPKESPINSIRLVSIDQLKNKLDPSGIIEIKVEPTSDSEHEAETAIAKKQLLTALNISEKPMFDPKVDTSEINKNKRIPSQRLKMQNNKKTPPEMFSESSKKVNKEKMKVKKIAPKPSAIPPNPTDKNRNSNSLLINKSTGNKRDSNITVENNLALANHTNSSSVDFTYRILSDTTGIFIELDKPNDTNISQENIINTSPGNNVSKNKNGGVIKNIETIKDKNNPNNINKNLNEIGRDINQINGNINNDSNRAIANTYRVRTDLYAGTSNDAFPGFTIDTSKTGNDISRTSTEKNCRFNIINVRNPPELTRSNSTVNLAIREPNVNETPRNEQIVVDSNDFNLLNGILHEGISRGVSQLICRQPPRLKPRPPCPISNSYEDSLPSTAGPITAKINSMAHKMSDYFRGILLETISEYGKSDNSEAEVVNLRLKIEEERHRHSEEITEIKKNVNSVLQDIQKAILEENEKVIYETKAACNLEMIKRVEEAKLTQWCANCLKEAVLYCCWNTSYCDYPCQSKHWPKHMAKCTQKPDQQNKSPSTLKKVPTPIILRPTAPPKTMAGKSVISKTTKLLVSKNSQKPINFTAVPGQLRLYDSTSGSFEVVGSPPLTLNQTVLNKIKACNVVAVSSPGNTAMPKTLLYTTTSTSDTRMNNMIISQKET